MFLRHCDPCYGVCQKSRDYRANGEYKPDYAHHRYIEAKVARHTRADASDLLFRHQAASLRGWPEGAGLGAV
jgi:hypothetical protein